MRGQAAANISVDFNKKLALNQVPDVVSAQNGEEDNEAAPAGTKDNRN